MRTLLKKIFLYLLLAASSLFTQAQIIITPQLPPTGLLQKDQLWNMVLVNNNEYTQDMQIQIILADLKTGEKILTGISKLLTINKGAQQLRITDVSPIQYNYSGEGTVNDDGNNGLLPIGRYQVCYKTLIIDRHNIGFEGTEACIPIEVQPLSPPQLNFPSHKDTVSTTYPVFQWLPPAPVNLFSALNYQLILVEVNKGQTIQDAVQKNSPVYTQDRINTLFFNYPSSAGALQEGKTYGWQVIAKNGNTYTEKTEAWQFTIKKDSALIILDYEAYPALKQGSSGDYYSCQGKMKFSYYNDTGDSSIPAQFYTVQNGNRQTALTKEIKIQRGENYIDMTIKSNKVFTYGKEYVMELINSKKQLWTLRFKYKPVEHE